MDAKANGGGGGCIKLTKLVAAGNGLTVHWPTVVLLDLHLEVCKGVEQSRSIVNSRAVEGVVSFRSFRLRVGRAGRDSRATFANTSPLVYRMRKEGSIVQLIKAFTQVLLFSQKLIFCSLMLFIFIFKILDECFGFRKQTQSRVSIGLWSKRNNLLEFL